MQNYEPEDRDASARRDADLLHEERREYQRLHVLHDRDPVKRPVKKVDDERH
jgi:hypothetical protein